MPDEQKKVMKEVWAKYEKARADQIRRGNESLAHAAATAALWYRVATEEAGKPAR
jgi:hypothetical protein